MSLVSLLLLQVEKSQLWQDSFKFFLVTLVFVAVIIVALVLTIRSIRKANNASVKDELAGEFDKQKEALLLMAQQKKAQRETAGSTSDDDEDGLSKELELLAANVNPADAVGKTCPLTGLEIYADNEIVIDPNTGAAYHFSGFLNDWPPETERPKYVYRHPQGEVVPSTDLVRNF